MPIEPATIESANRIPLLQTLQIRLLEIGVLKGASLRMWADYFPQGQITGVDLTLTSSTVLAANADINMHAGITDTAAVHDRDEHVYGAGGGQRCGAACLVGTGGDAQPGLLAGGEHGAPAPAGSCH